MLSPTRGATRVARAAAFGVATLALASGAHVVAGGTLPPVMVLVALALPLTIGAVILTGRRCGALLLLSSLAVAQVVLHEALMRLTVHDPAEMLTAAAGARPGSAGFASGSMSGHSASSMDSMEAAMGGVTLAGAEGWSATMMALHVLATVVTALLLAYGEQALWQLVARLLPGLPRLPRLLSCGPRQALVLLSEPVLRPCLVSGGSGLRGPPAGLPATA